jgi:hypothetical protein
MSTMENSYCMVSRSRRTVAVALNIASNSNYLLFLDVNILCCLFPSTLFEIVRTDLQLLHGECICAIYCLNLSLQACSFDVNNFFNTSLVSCLQIITKHRRTAKSQGDTQW